LILEADGFARSGTDFGIPRAKEENVRADQHKLAHEEITMSIEKKSLLSGLNATKKAIVASSATPTQPTINAPVSARIQPRVRARVAAKVAAKVTARVAAKVAARKK
jgi:hypothetical protein